MPDNAREAGIITSGSGPSHIERNETELGYLQRAKREMLGWKEI